jgi:hypothetical protein
MNPANICKNCRYWQLQDDEDKAEDFAMGQCVRYAPRPAVPGIEGTIQASWPFTYSFQKCGEFDSLKEHYGPATEYGSLDVLLEYIERTTKKNPDRAAKLMLDGIEEQCRELRERFFKPKQEPSS